MPVEPWQVFGKDVVIWIGAIATLGLYTLLYRENPVYRIFEHLFVGVGAGFTARTYLTEIVVPNWGVPMFQQGEWWRIFGLLIGLMFYFIYSRRFVWIARLVMLGILALNAGTFFKGFVTLYAPQFASSFKSPVLVDEATRQVMWFPSFNNIVFLVSLLSVMSYFFFSIEHKGPLLRSAQLGRWIAMIAFGSIFGTTIMGRLSLFLGRVNFLLFDFLGLPPP